jgi:O-antigen/teichoic acid export membrane protein
MATVAGSRSSARSSTISLRGGALLTLAILFANVSNYIFQVLSGRWLGPQEYSLLASVFTLIAIVGVSASSVQAACAKGEAVRRASLEDPDVERRAGLFDDPLVRSVLCVSVAVGALVTVFSPALGRFFHSSTGPVIGFALLVPSMGLLAIVYGRLQGLERFLGFAALSLGLALAKVGFGGAVVAAGGGVTSTIMTLAVVSTLGALVGLMLTRDAAPLAGRALAGDTARALIAMTIFWALLSVDVPLARHWLDHDRAGQYAAAAVIGKGILWLPDIVALVVFPSLATAVRAGEEAMGLLGKAVALSAGLCLAGCAALFVIGEPMFRILYGEGYSGASDIAWKLGLASVPFSIANLLIFYFLAREEWRWMILLVGVAAGTLTAFVLFHDNTTQFVLITALSALALAVALALGVIATRRSPATSDARP